jgi:hypothetical protein
MATVFVSRASGIFAPRCLSLLKIRTSLPPYDLALQSFFKHVLSKGTQALILVLSPESRELAKRWQAICPKSTRVLALPGLPEALDLVWE